jgi:hypothetical protein
MQGLGQVVTPIEERDAKLVRGNCHRNAEYVMGGTSLDVRFPRYSVQYSCSELTPWGRGGGGWTGRSGLDGAGGNKGGWSGMIL